jgi:hypothetical protein
MTKHPRCPSPYIFSGNLRPLDDMSHGRFIPERCVPRLYLESSGKGQHIRRHINRTDRLREKESQKNGRYGDALSRYLFFSSPEMESLEGSNFVPYDPSQEPLFPLELTLSPHLDSQDLVFRWKYYFLQMPNWYLVNNRVKTWTDVGDKTFKDLLCAGGKEPRGIGRSVCPTCWASWRSIQEPRYFHLFIVFVKENATF